MKVEHQITADQFDVQDFGLTEQAVDPHSPAFYIIIAGTLAARRP